MDTTNFDLTNSISTILQNPYVILVIRLSSLITVLYIAQYFVRLYLAKRNAKKQEGFVMQVIPPKYVKDDSGNEQGVRFALQRFVDNLTASVKTGRVSFEIYADNTGIKFLVWTPTKQMQNLIKLNLYSKYKERVKVKELDYDPLKSFKPYESKIDEYKTAKHDIYMLMDVKDFQSVDSINDILVSMTGLKENEKMLFQIALQPTQMDKIAFNKAKEHFRLGKSEITWFQIFLQRFDIYLIYFLPLLPVIVFKIINEFMKAFQIKSASTILDPQDLMHDSDARKIKVQLEDLANFNQRIDEKYKTSFTTNIRVIASGIDVEAKLNSIEQALESMKSETQNRLIRKRVNRFNDILTRFIYPTDNAFPFFKQWFTNQITLSSREISMLYHLPSEIISPVIDNFVFPDIAAQQVFTKKEEPSDIYIGDNFLRNKANKVYLSQKLRARHITVIGQTGTGKSTLLKNSINQDLTNALKGTHRGGMILDPHEDLFLSSLYQLPQGALDVNKIIPWDSRSEEYYIGFNPIYAVGLSEREIELIVDSTYKLIEKLVKRLNPEAGMGVTGKPMLMFGMETLMIFQLEWAKKYPDKIDVLKKYAPTLLNVRDLYTNDEFYNTVISFIDLKRYEKIRSFWEDILPNYKESKAWHEIRLGFDNKLSQIITGILFYTFAQSQSSIDIGKIIKRSKFLLVNVSSKNLGEEGMSLLGSLLMAKTWFEAKKIGTKDAMNFVVYADEFQNFATSDFAQVLSEARKFKLELILANQYSAQLPKEVKEAVHGNAKTRIYYRVGLDDAEEVSLDLQQNVLLEEVMETPDYHAFVRSGSDVFTIAASPEPRINYSEFQIDNYIQEAYEKYGKHKTDIEQEIIDRKLWFRDGCLPEIKKNKVVNNKL